MCATGAPRAAPPFSCGRTGGPLSYEEQGIEHTLQERQLAFVRFHLGEHYTNRDIVDTPQWGERAFLRGAKERGIVAICQNRAENPALSALFRIGGGPGRARLASALLSEGHHQAHKTVLRFVRDAVGAAAGANPWC